MVLEKLTLRRPLRHSWRIWVFYGSHGSGLTFIPKRSKIITQKSIIADFFEYSIFGSACETNKERLKISDSDFTYYGVYLFFIFGIFLDWFGTVIWYIFNLLFGHFLGSLVTFEVWSGGEKRRDSSYNVTHAP